MFSSSFIISPFKCILPWVQVFSHSLPVQQDVDVVPEMLYFFMLYIYRYNGGYDHFNQVSIFSISLWFFLLFFSLSSYLVSTLFQIIIHVRRYGSSLLSLTISFFRRFHAHIIPWSWFDDWVILSRPLSFNVPQAFMNDLLPFAYFLIPYRPLT